MWDTGADSCSLAEVGYHLLVFTGAGLWLLNIAGQNISVPFVHRTTVLPSAEASTASRGCCAHPSLLPTLSNLLKSRQQSTFFAQSLLQKTINSSTAPLIRQDKPVSF